MQSRMKSYFEQVGAFGATDTQLHEALGLTSRTIYELRRALSQDLWIEEVLGVTREVNIRGRIHQEQVYRKSSKRKVEQ